MTCGSFEATAMLHHKLQEMYHEAKLEPPNISDTYHMELVCRARSVAKAYVGLDDRFAILLGNAVPDLFTFIRYPGMEPTNNESERMLRKVVIHRKIRQKLVTVGGKIMFGTIMTCLLTWDKMGLNWFEKLSEVFLGDITYYAKSYAKVINHPLLYVLKYGVQQPA